METINTIFIYNISKILRQINKLIFLYFEQYAFISWAWSNAKQTGQLGICQMNIKGRNGNESAT